MSSLAQDFVRQHIEHVRLTILQLLSELPGYFANDSVLADAVNGMGLSCSRDQMRGSISWLTEQGLVTKLQPGSGVIVATLTQRGNDVALGRSSVPGVKRPSPGLE